MSSFLDWEVDLLQSLMELRVSFVDTIVKIINFTGEVTFFTILLPIIYWLVSKRVGFQLAIVLFVSYYVNVFLKDLFEWSRPFIMHADRIKPLVDQGGYTFPSGHSQHSFAVWAFLASVIRRRSFTIFAILMIIAVGFSRLYSGVHFPKDVLFGWFLGAVIVLITSLIIRNQLLSTLSNRICLAIAIIIPIVLLPLYHGVTNGRLDQEGAYQASGLLAFSILGYVWEREKVNFSISKSWVQKVIACVIGLIGIILIKEGFKLFLPEEAIADFFRYGMIGLWTIAIAPRVFVKLRLAATNR
ncbi:phosphatase PAP2 family protein [Paenibacillus endoradicis]|uniref:phosphatase PAP2 family protein n=1 Tax=Paenibacillus endoradicis TaxID=2972487 RepID=UPI0021598D50|nr:phosphatase PAP2 family protein [Paenibacillus endoradicis]MCR8656340.1 phosphatase PAP2 family protein [Paenibacillus endoradicis]